MECWFRAPSTLLSGCNVIHISGGACSSPSPVDTRQGKGSHPHLKRGRRHGLPARGHPPISSHLGTGTNESSWGGWLTGCGVDLHTCNLIDRTSEQMGAAN